MAALWKMHVFYIHMYVHVCVGGVSRYRRCTNWEAHIAKQQEWLSLGDEIMNGFHFLPYTLIYYHLKIYNKNSLQVIAFLKSPQKLKVKDNMLRIHSKKMGKRS